MVSKGRKVERASERVQRRREASLKRNLSFREPKRRIYIVTEGTVTEREYFENLARAYRQFVKVSIAGEHGVPRTVVEIAIREKTRAEEEARKCEDSFLTWDEVWAVFDRDEHHDVPAAISTASAAGIRVAFSNPCFELWALLHFREQRAHIERDAAQKALTEHMPGYVKSLNIDLMEPLLDHAHRRARDLSRIARKDGDPLKNPTTGVFALVESIRQKG